MSVNPANATLAITQIMNTGKVQGDELNQLDAISRAHFYESIGDLLGKSKEDVIAMQNAGKLSADLGLYGIFEAIRRQTGADDPLGTRSKEYGNTLEGLMKITRGMFEENFMGVNIEPVKDVFRSLVRLMGDGSEASGLFRDAINDLYDNTFGKLSRYLDMLIDDPDKAAQAIKELRQRFSQSVNFAKQFAVGLRDVARGVMDFLEGVRPAFEWVGRFVGGLDDGESSVARMAGRIFGMIAVFSLLNMATFGLTGKLLELSGQGLWWALTNMDKLGAMATRVAGVFTGTVTGATAGLALGLAGLIAIVVGVIAIWGDWEALGRSLAALMRGDWRLAWEEWSNAVTFKQEAMVGVFDAIWAAIERVIGAIRRLGNWWQSLMQKIYPSEGKGARFWDGAYAFLSGGEMPSPTADINGVNSGAGSSGGRPSPNVNLYNETHVHQTAGQSDASLVDEVGRTTATTLIQFSDRLAMQSGIAVE